MRITLFTTLLCIVPIIIASAGIGENEAAVATRYGKTFGDIPTVSFGTMRGFMSGDYVVGVKLVDGVSEMEMFSKTDQSEMLATEIKNLLKTSNSGEWKAEQTGKPNWRRWHSENGALVAIYDTTRHFLYINSKKFYENQAKKIEKDQEEIPKGSGD